MRSQLLKEVSYPSLEGASGWCGAGAGASRQDGKNTATHVRPNPDRVYQSEGELHEHSNFERRHHHRLRSIG